MIVRKPHMRHCDECNHCVEFYQLYSPFLGKAIGLNNSIAYWFFVLFGTLLNGLLALSLCLSIASHQHAGHQSATFLLWPVLILDLIYS